MTWLAAFDNDMGEGGKRLVRRFAEAGHAAYFVGGCVRDALLGRPIKDIDIATSARPEATMALFPEAIPTGLQHGTVSIPMDGYLYEVTTFRAESDYSDGRHPDEVVFIGEIEGDLERRDFTVNAMAVGEDGALVDPFGGRADLEARVLRAVGDPEARFGEDALRMLRCVRFAAEYGFAVEPQTWAEARLGAPGLARIAMERVFAELERMIGGADPYRAVTLLRESELLRWCKDRLRLPRTLGTQSNGADPLESIGTLPDGTSRWGLWFVRMELTPEEAALNCKALRTPNAFAADIDRLLRLHGAVAGFEATIEAARKAWVTAVLRYGVEASQRWLTMAPALPASALAASGTHAAAHGGRWLAEMPVAGLAELAVGGKDLLAAAGARKGGPWVSALLDRLLRAAALGELPNEREPLLAKAAAWLEAEGRDGNAR
ncbi:CCA tRNA nucleotidyltransferase [Paenibacillus sp. TRM 82003]|nr:CCA tRNA nucleotidyltransferase [Paenibacillus sp. TRM 82003]